MALGANFHVDILLGRTRYERIAAVTGHGRLIIIRMDAFSHDSHLTVHVLLSFSHSANDVLSNSFLIITHSKSKCKLFMKLLQNFLFADHMDEFLIGPRTGEHIQDLFHRILGFQAI